MDEIKRDLPSHLSSLHDPLTAHGVNAHVTEQFSAPHFAISPWIK